MELLSRRKSSEECVQSTGGGDWATHPAPALSGATKTAKALRVFSLSALEYIFVQLIGGGRRLRRQWVEWMMCSMLCRLIHQDYYPFRKDLLTNALHWWSFVERSLPHWFTHTPINRWADCVMLVWAHLNYRILRLCRNGFDLMCLCISWTIMVWLPCHKHSTTTTQHIDYSPLNMRTSTLKVIIAHTIPPVLVLLLRWP